jgi:hypothetical protein
MCVYVIACVKTLSDASRDVKTLHQVMIHVCMYVCMYVYAYVCVSVCVSSDASRDVKTFT